MPASNAPMSSENTIASLRTSGTCSSAIRFAKPSAIAVLPTPGSPTYRGLFFVLLHRICIVLSTSNSRPIRGSMLPDFDLSLRFTQYALSASFPLLLFSSALSSSVDVDPSELEFKGFFEMPWEIKLTASKRDISCSFKK